MAGIGGGGLIIPFIILFYGFNAKEATQQAAFYIFMGGLVRYIINIPLKSPFKPEWTIIDYDIAAIYLPLNLLGANIGGVLNIMFPNFIVDVCFFLTLLFVIVKLFMKAVETYKKESVVLAKMEIERAIIIAEAVASD